MSGGKRKLQFKLNVFSLLAIHGEMSDAKELSCFSRLRLDALARSWDANFATAEHHEPTGNLVNPMRRSESDV